MYRILGFRFEGQRCDVKHREKDEVQGSSEFEGLGFEVRESLDLE